MFKTLRANIIPLTVALSLLMELVDATILATAIPVIAHELGVPALSLKMAMAAYLIALAAFVPVSGWIADRFGAKRVFIAALGVFAAASLLCAVQTTLPGLVIARALQGLGAAMMSPVGRLIVLRNTARSEITRAMVYVTMPALIGPALGPVFGATLTTFFGWRAIFLINLPLAALAIALTLRHMPADGAPIAKPFDTMGFLLSALGLVAAMTGLSSLGEHVLPWQASLGLTGLGVLALVLYWRRAQGRADALLDPKLFRYRTFDIGVIGSMIFRLSNGAVLLLLPLFFQLTLKTGIVVSGALVGLNALGAVSVRALVPRILDRFGFKPVMILAAVLRGLAIVGLASVSSLHDWQLVPLLVIGGAAQATVFTSINAIAYAELGAQEISTGTAFIAMSRQLSLALGIAFAGVVLELAITAVGGVPASGVLPHSAFVIGFVATGLMGPISALYFARLKPGDADGLRRVQPAQRAGSHEPPTPERAA
ncbi:major facilitator transporter [Thioclava dalianensis]|uniref:Major facilitator transporter n=1 Tax=Thioclava dalianensis TaxID=1185766 RepID=A0A074T946_9RHOB|nr:MFS transporter [Thioclava dalianensis]KEP68291.1 major facilitator transporter [Thioclava dalianensis]SFN48497.1 drug resistance transporter, EmrB/QacA subfamily [Thioclava dalianensis]